MIHLIESLNITSSPYINAALSIPVFILLAKAVDLFVDKVARRFSKFTTTEIDDRIIDTIHRPIFFTVILIGIVMAVTYLSLLQRTTFYIHGALYTCMALLWTATTIKISNIIIEHSVQKVSDVTGLSKDIVPLIENMSKIAIVLASLMVILSIWKVNITPILASAGIAGAGIALAAKDTIANFFGGISVFVDKPFKIGDFIVLDRGERGEVVNIGIRSTRIKTLDDIMITIPNSVIINSKIVNESAPTPYLRLRIPVGVAYGTDIDQAEKILVELALQNDNVIKDPAPRAVLTTFGEYALNFELLCWIKEPSARLRTVDALNKAIYKKFNECGIKIPYPQREVHVYQQPVPAPTLINQKA
ncbi:MAG: mechanosensitive ion channel family protein [Nitrospirota bacterium]